MRHEYPLQHLVYEEVRKAALEYFRAEMLTAQAPNHQDAVCVNKGKDHRRCAAAAGFNIALLLAAPDGTIMDVIDTGKATTDNLPALRMLQAVHDEWANAVRAHGEAVKYDHGENTIDSREAVKLALQSVFETIVRQN